MDEGASFQPHPNVAADIVEGEAILIRLEDGIYFSMNPMGTRIWRLVEARSSVERMASLIAASCSVAKDVAARDLRTFLRRLVDLRLVQPCTGGVTAEAPNLEPMSYVLPEVDAYEDMAELLALDPPSPGRTIKSFDPE
jgi:hypothetical protein